MYVCDECGKQFPSGWNALENHCRDTGHYHQAIVDCYGEDFYDDYYDSDEDMDDCDEDLECYDCDFIFDTEEELTQHEIDEHWFCSECDWHFNSHGSIKSHMRSWAHAKTRIDCPYCRKEYTTASGFCNHLEAGSCAEAPELNRETIYQLVRRQDPEGCISKVIVKWAGAMQYEVTDAWYNHQTNNWHCNICERQFHDRHDLVKHMEAAVHQDVLYHCPNPDCHAPFTTLAGCIGHMESETCGAIDFESVQYNIGEGLGGAIREVSPDY